MENPLDHSPFICVIKTTVYRLCQGLAHPKAWLLLI